MHHRIANADAYLRFLAAAKRTVSNPAYDFIFIHWNHPHKPFFYDRFKDDFVDRPETDSGYIDQLELVDRTLGEIETALRDNDLWDSTMIIISADHGWRRSTIYDGKFDLRVPMVIKLAGQKRPFVYRKRLETIHTHRLVKAAFAGRLAGPEDIAPVMRGDAPRN